MNTPAPKNLPASLYIHIEVPSLHFDFVQSVRFSQLVCAPLECALSVAGLLASPAPLSEEKKALALSAGAALGKLVEVVDGRLAGLEELKKFLALDTASSVLSRDEVAALALAALALAALGGLKRLCAGPAIHVFPFSNGCLLAFETPRHVDAGMVLFAELEHLDLLRFCEVAILESSNCLRTVFPIGCEKPFIRHWEKFQALRSEQNATATEALRKIKEGLK